MLTGRIARLKGSLASPARRATAGTLFTSVILQGALVVSGALTARLLGVEGRGELAFLLLVPRIVVLLGSLGVPMALTYYVARAPESTTTLLRSLAPIGLLQSALLLGLSAGVLFVGLPSRSSELVTASLIILPAVPARLVYTYALGIVQGQRRFLAFNVLRASSGVLYATAVLGLFLADQAALPLIAIGWTASFLIACALGIVAVMSGLPRRGTGSAPSSTEVLRFGMRGVLGWVSPIDGLRADQAVTAFFLSPVALGLYVTAQAFTTFPRFVAVGVGSVAYPNIAAQSSVEAARRSWGRYVWLTVAVSGAVSGGLALGAPALVPLFFGADFSGAVPAMRLLLLVAFLWSVRRILADGARGLGLPELGSIAEISSWVALVPGLVVLVPAWGFNGVAAALVVSSTVGLLIILAGLLVKRTTPLSPRLDRAGFAPRSP